MEHFPFLLPFLVSALAFWDDVKVLKLQKHWKVRNFCEGVHPLQLPLWLMSLGHSVNTGWRHSVASLKFFSSVRSSTPWKRQQEVLQTWLLHQKHLVFWAKKRQLFSLTFLSYCYCNGSQTLYGHIEDNRARVGNMDNLYRNIDRILYWDNFNTPSLCLDFQWSICYPHVNWPLKAKHIPHVSVFTD